MTRSPMLQQHRLVIGFAFAVMLTLMLTLAHAAPPPAGPTHPARDWQAIQRVIGDQLKALKAGDGKKAMSFAAPGIKSQFGSPENFMRMIRGGYGPLLDASYTAFLEGAIVEGNTIQPMRLVMPDSRVLVALYQMQKQEDGQWRIVGCVLAPSTVQST